MLNELDINVSALKQKYCEGTHVLLFGVDGVPDNTKGVVDLIDDIGRIFIETGVGLKNVVLSPDDENVHFVRDCIDYDNIVSNNFHVLTDVEFDDDLPGVCGSIEVTDFFVVKVPELAYCLSLDNDDWVNGRAFWNMKTGEVILSLFNNTVDVDSTIEKEFVLTGRDKEWVVNAFNKEFIERYGLPVKLGFDYVRKEDIVFSYLNSYPKSAVSVANDPSFLNRVNVCCEIYDLNMTRKIVHNLAEKTQVHAVSKDINVSNFELSDDGKYVGFTVEVKEPLVSFEGLFRISNTKRGKDMALVSLDGDCDLPVVAKSRSAIEALVRDYVEFKGLDEKVASVDKVLADAKSKNVLSDKGREVVSKEGFCYGE